MKKVKSRLKPTKEMVERVANEAVHDMVECLQDETAIGIIATARMFGLGEKRLKKYINFLKDVKAEFGQYNDEGILRYKIDAELTSRNIDPKAIYTEVGDIRQMIRKPKPSVSLKEAIDLDKKLKEFKEWCDNDN